ncbi:AAA family ATPase [Actinomadura soli]|nr:LuxR family transcriptional regulator [Actinomadura soli]
MSGTPGPSVLESAALPAGVSPAGTCWDWGDRAPFDVLAAAVHRGRSGEGGTLLVRGRFGSGRSTLLRAIASFAEREGFLTLRSFGHLAEKDVPLGLIDQLVDALDGVDGRSMDGAADGHALYRVLRELTRRSPVLLCLDDVQWADPASLRRLGFLARRIENLPLLVVAAVRDGEPLADPAAVAELAEERLCRGVVTLEPLTRPETMEVVRRHVPGAADEAVAACWRLARGNRLLLREAVALLAARIPLTDRTGAGPELTARLTADLRRLAPLTLATAIAELGDSADREMLVHVTGLPEHDCEDALRALAAAGFLRADRPVFVHPLVQATVAAHTSAAVRAVLHGSAACRLRTRRAQAERIARHLVHVAPGFRPWTAETLLFAARAEIARSGPAAAPLIERTLREKLPDDVGAELMIELGRAFLRREIPGAPSCFDRAAALTADPRLLSEAAAGKAVALFHLGRPDDARAALRPVAGSGPLLSLFTACPVPAGWVPRAGLMHLDVLVRCLGLLGDDRLTEEMCERRAGFARRRGDLCGEAVALLMRGLVTLRAGRLAQARADLAAASALLADAGAAPTAALPRLAFAGQAEAAVRSGDAGAAAAAVEAAGGFDRPTSGWWDALLLAARAEVHLAQGEADRARADLLEFLDWLDDRPGAPGPITSWCARATILACRVGLGDHARRLASQVLGAAEASGGPRRLGLALHAFGVAHGDVDCLQRAIRLLADPRTRLCAAEAHVDLGAELRRRRQYRRARHHLREGLTLGVVCGAKTLIVRACDELLSAGGRLRRMPPHLLTNGEERVAVLAGEGLTNGEIARRLCITRRTVETHLTHTYRKLGITNRSELPRALHSHGIPCG